MLFVCLWGCALGQAHFGRFICRPFIAQLAGVVFKCSTAVTHVKCWGPFHFYVGRQCRPSLWAAEAVHEGLPVRALQRRHCGPVPGGGGGPVLAAAPRRRCAHATEMAHPAPPPREHWTPPNARPFFNELFQRRRWQSMTQHMVAEDHVTKSFKKGGKARE